MEVVDEDEDDIVSKSDMAGCVTGKRTFDDAEDEAFKKVSFKKPKAFRKKMRAEYD